MSATQLKELNQIGFDADPDLPFAQSLAENYRLLFPEALNAAQQAQALATIAIDDHQTLATLVETAPTQMTRTQFYAVALQLLSFHPEFKVLAPQSFKCKTPQLPVVDTDLTPPQLFLRRYISY
jgi:X-Pro dipeptidyl-peptidase